MYFGVDSDGYSSQLDEERLIFDELEDLMTNTILPSEEGLINPAPSKQNKTGGNFNNSFNKNFKYQLAQNYPTPFNQSQELIMT